MRPRDLSAGLAALGILAVLAGGILRGVAPGTLVRRALASALLCGAAGGAAALAWPRRAPAVSKETVEPPGE